MVRIESKELDKFYDVDVSEDSENLMELIATIAVSIKHTMSKYNMTYNDVISQVEMFTRGTKLGVGNDGNKRSKQLYTWL